MSAFFELLCVFLYAFVFPKLPIVKYYRAKAASEGSRTVAADLAAAGIEALPDTGVSFSSAAHIYAIIIIYFCKKKKKKTRKTHDLMSIVEIVADRGGSQTSGASKQQTAVGTKHRLRN